MITFSEFGNHGRTGNMLFQYASIIGIAKSLNSKFILPSWEGAEYFDSEYQKDPIIKPNATVNEAGFEFDETIVTRCRDIIASGKIPNLHGYFQSENYWKHCRALVKNTLTFKKSITDQLKRKYYKSFKKKVIAIHVRRGDYVNNPNYAQIRPDYYISALLKHFPDWRKYNLIIFSDDMAYCKVHFDCIDNVAFAEGNSPMEDLALMSLCTHFIIPNSSFAWWGAYLGQKNGSRVIRPTEHFKGKLKDQSTKDYYPEGWIEHKADKIDLSDVTFTIPVCWDSRDRKKNLDLCVYLIQTYFRTTIIIGEQGGNQFYYMSKYAEYIQFPYKNFHRTKMLNDMARMSTTPFVANWDADVTVSPFQLFETVEKLRGGQDIVYPYNGQFARIPRLAWFRKLEETADIGIVGSTKFNGMNNNDDTSYGGAVIVNKDSFFKMGGENENFISFGPEDYERYHRFKTLGAKIARTPGPIYHINHWVGMNSSNRHPFVKQNREEWNKVYQMEPEDLAKYIKTWKTAIPA